MTKLERRARNYIRAHKKILTFATLTTLAAVLQARHIAGLNQYLDDNDLFEPYYGFPLNEPEE